MMDITSFVLIAGYLVLAFIAIEILHFAWLLFRGYVLTSFGFVKDIRKYGDWAIVTGATDGMGKEYAQQLAKKGFNIVLISRTLSKLETVANAIEEEYGVKTKVISYDFSKNEKSGYEHIECEVSGLDVGILVNNVGMADAKIKKFIDRPIDTITGMLHINIFADVHMTHMVLKGMVERKRGAVIHISAGAVYINNFPFPVYAAAKTFMTKLVKALQFEYPGVIDHQVVHPFGVATSMGGGMLKPGLTVPTAKEYVRKAIAAIGIMQYTHGCPAHEIMGCILQALPPSVVSFLFPIVFADFIKKVS